MKRLFNRLALRFAPFTVRVLSADRTHTHRAHTFADALSWAQQYPADWGRVVITGRFNRQLAERGKHENQ
jgi:hypothetical protein